MADHLANSWESHVGSLVEGDPIVALSWLHNGVKLALHVEKVGVPAEQAGAVGDAFTCLSTCSLPPPLPPPASFGFLVLGRTPACSQAGSTRVLSELRALWFHNVPQ